VSEEGADLGATHLVGMALAVEEDVALGPVEIGLLGANAVVLATQKVAHLAEEPGAPDDPVGIHGDVGMGGCQRGWAHGVLRVLGAGCLGQV
jgi:hypothetical protein